MFTGIIEEMGSIQQLQREGKAMVLTVRARKILENIALGDSIAVNGVCLTAVSFTSTTVTMDVMPETYRHTALRELQVGQAVNLERAMTANSRFGGHMVQGHVDGTGTVLSRERQENAVVFTIRPELPELLRMMIPRGSIALDGISLTLIRVEADSFSVSIIPHTLQETTLQHKQAGSSVNIETDVTGKYIFRFLETMTAHDKGTLSRRSGMTEQFLAEHGFA